MKENAVFSRPFTPRNILAGPLLLLAFLIIASPAALAQDRDVVYQVSTIDALLNGVYDGEITYGQMAEHGDFGLGTFEGLDGEMVAVDGEFLQVRADGKVYPVSPDQTTPFAAVTFFDPDLAFAVENVASFEDLKAQILKQIPDPNRFYAILIKGDFSHVKTRSVPKQDKPYPPLAEVAKHQPEFEFNNVSGLLAGFYCPEFVQKINVTGFHLHFLNTEKTGGGHLLEVSMAKGDAALDMTPAFFMLLPDAARDVDYSQDKSKELEEVEQ